MPEVKTEKEPSHSSFIVASVMPFMSGVAEGSNSKEILTHRVLLTEGNGGIVSLVKSVGSN